MTIDEADRLYLQRKQEASAATIREFVDYLMTHEGNPAQEFVAKVRSSPEEYRIYITNLEGLLQDPGYADDFFGATGKVLKVESNHVKTWAEKIAQATLDQTPTLQ